MYEVDFLPVENDEQDGGKSGDAIAIRFTVPGRATPVVVVIDGGFTAVGQKLVDHIKKYYETVVVDLMISTHPDADHLNGLCTVIDQLSVSELLVHQPRLHRTDLTEFTNLEALDNLIKTARARNVKLTEPFTGLSRFNGSVKILGPTENYYEDLLDESLGSIKASAFTEAFRRHWVQQVGQLLDKALTYLPVETLADDGETTARNNSSVITLVSVDGERLLFTGDAGIPALDTGASEYERLFDSFDQSPISFFQAPHHGSKRNVGPTILDRILGPTEAPFSSYVSFISSAKAAPKHPSPKVVNALKRRGCDVLATEGQSICHSVPGVSRPGWVPLEPLPPLAEDDDE
ncbi:ComEC/Rec2 family competence protein [Mangrovihabitans endophyticus]|uniref:Metal-dependent hydrolase, beta-lactamase superfamily II n=1 Tax=Mangrovihabitans endophyticus TaxID=1751298 RepID=A0A8J3FNT7_9ACTN|nr:MBL fold metallo-hydrolase [Mangrovihabitans endophyticus]GGK94002.1 hypothetical protein GCM10012284_30090 [Mangrovihabitans endophyticus]